MQISSSGESRMVLLGVGVSWFCRDWLHKEDYAIEDEIEVSNKTEQDLRKPAQYWLLGFKDRELETEYLDNLVCESPNRIYLGYFICLSLVLFGIFSYDVAG